MLLTCARQRVGFCSSREHHRPSASDPLGDTRENYSESEHENAVFLSYFLSDAKCIIINIILDLSRQFIILLGRNELGEVESNLHCWFRLGPMLHDYLAPQLCRHNGGQSIWCAQSLTTARSNPTLKLLPHTVWPYLCNGCIFCWGQS